MAGLVFIGLFVFSAVFALYAAYLIWHTAVREIGNVKTSMYSNLTPLVGLVVAIVWLGERMTATKAAGAGCLSGLRLLERADVRDQEPHH